MGFEPTAFQLGTERAIHCATRAFTHDWIRTSEHNHAAEGCLTAPASGAGTCDEQIAQKRHFPGENQRSIFIFLL